MSPNDALSTEEFGFLSELSQKYEPLHCLDVHSLIVKDRYEGEWLIEFVEPNNHNAGRHRAYGANISAKDVDGFPLGVAVFKKDRLILSKVHVFRYDGDGPIRVLPGSLEVSETA